MNRLPILTMLALLALAAPVPAKVLRDISYIEREGSAKELTSLDLHLPLRKPAKPAPVMIMIHGGGWAIGDKSNLGFVQPKTTWFLRHGFIVASINYRLSPAVTHPAHIVDVCAAIAWIERNIAKHGGDPKQLHLLGHSAGAHLAALAGVDRTRLKAAGADPAAIKHVILLDGAGYDVPKQIAAARLPRAEKMYRDAFTNDPKTQRDASPTLAKIKNPPDFLILHVASREASKIQSEALASALRKAGGKAKVLGIPDKTHGTINRDLGKPGDQTTQAVAEALGLTDGRSIDD